MGDVMPTKQPQPPKSSTGLGKAESMPQGSMNTRSKDRFEVRRKRNRYKAQGTNK